MEQHAFALDELEREVHIIGEPAFPAPVQLRMGDFRKNAPDRMVAQFTLPCGFPFQFPKGKLSRLRKTDDSGNVFRCGTLTAFLLTAVDEVFQANPLANIKHSHAFRTVQLVGARGKHIDTQLIDIDRNMSEGLDRIGMEGDSMGFRDLSQACDRFDRSDFVIGKHDGCEDGVFPDRRFELPGVDKPVAAYGKVGNLKTFAFERLARMQDGVVLDCRCDDVGPMLPIGARIALERPIVRFRPT